MTDPDRKDLQFLGLEGAQCNPETAQTVVLPLPLEKTTTYGKGTAQGPQAIVTASTQVEFFDPELVSSPCEKGIFTDWELGNPAWNQDPMEDSLDKIRTQVGSWLEKGKFILSVGGEHTITVGAIDPYIERWKDDLTVVQIDAHADLRDQYMGSPYNHACVMRRIHGRLPIVGAGIRALEKEEYEVAQGDGVDLFFAHDIHKNPNWIRDLLACIKTEKVYLTVDLDGLDPSVIPSVGTPQPGGLLWYETLDLIRAVAQEHQIVGADVNELCPGPARHADFAAAALCYKMIGYALENRT